MLSENFDAVVMLTMSDWHSEMRSNRYHYATRFARTHKVYFVQPDGVSGTIGSEALPGSNIEIVHVCPYYGPRQSDLLYSFLKARGVLRPILWIYNSNFLDFISSYQSNLKVFHGTEDFFGDELLAKSEFTALTKSVLRYCDTVITVSAGVAESYRRSGRFKRPIHVLTNGVDLDEWIVRDSEVISKRSKTAVYQGNLNRKIDLPLLVATIQSMPDWTFKIIGAFQEAEGVNWDDLLRLPNVKFLGKLLIDKLVSEVKACDVGIIPFHRTEVLENRSFPLKALEYLASGLRVVSTPIKNLEPYAPHVVFAEDASSFVAEILKAASAGPAFDEKSARERLRADDYDFKFSELEKILSQLSIVKSTRNNRGDRKNILLLFDPGTLKVASSNEHLESFARYSRHKVWFAPATGKWKPKYDLNLFDAVVLHYTVRTTFDHIHSGFMEALEKFRGLKLIFVQDEYDNVKATRQFVRQAGFHILFTCVPKKYWDYVYPKESVGNIELIENLTGYVSPTDPPQFDRVFDRENVIGYRGRDLPFWYGDLGQEKALIGKRMKEECIKRGIAHDIEWGSDKRIYGEDWVEFVGSSRCFLGTESGANVFDFDGTLPARIQMFLKQRPRASYEEVREEFFPESQNEIRMNQISPKIFEAIAEGTALVLFEGEYSNVIKPYEHFIPVKKDFSNLDEVFRLIQDRPFIEKMVRKAYDHVMASGSYSYENFISKFDWAIDQYVLTSKGAPLQALCQLGGLWVKRLKGVGDYQFANYVYHKQAGHFHKGQFARMRFALSKYLTKAWARHLTLKTGKLALAATSLVIYQKSEILEMRLKRKFGRLMTSRGL